MYGDLLSVNSPCIDGLTCYRHSSLISFILSINEWLLVVLNCCVWCIWERYTNSFSSAISYSQEQNLLLAKQETEYGINMFDSLRPEDNTVFQAYMSQGFSKEEAALMIFERKYGQDPSSHTQKMSMVCYVIHAFLFNCNWIIAVYKFLRHHFLSIDIKSLGYF